GTAGIWHHVELTSLSPDSVYHYRVGDGDTWSSDYTFKTGTIGEQTTFVAWGDSRHFREERRDLMNTVNALDHDLSLFTGDFVDDGSSSTQWNDWFSDFSPLLNHVPFMAVQGSHEKNHSNYYNAFAFPGKEEYYSFNYGPIHFIGLHSDIPDYGGTYNETIDWLLDDLETHQSYKWKIVAMHNPAYSSSENYLDGDFDDFINLFVPIFEENNISVVFSGHKHLYERLQKNNITYVISGGAGAKPHIVVEDYIIEESVYAETAYHAVLLEVFENQIDMRAFRTNKTLMDQFTINKVDKPDLRCNTLAFTNKISKGVNQDITISIKNIGEINITEETTARIEISNGESWDVTVPPLDVYESVDFLYEWNATESEIYTWTIITDVEDQIDEVVEDNNQVVLTFDASEPEETSFFVRGFWGILAFLSSIMLVAVVKQRRRKQS
ncbi:MAG: metallophosphoesterase, partial [Candidatus Heimdallarchaeota archaeon]|nr:metallophosphoesterase [Candidatus Heimdallarchaeota archaeon]